MFRAYGTSPVDVTATLTPVDPSFTWGNSLAKGKIFNDASNIL